MTQKKRAGGSVQKVTDEIVGRLRDVRALWFAVYNDPRHSLSELCPEFYDKVGEVLEGKPLDALTYHLIDKELVMLYSEGP